MLTKSVASVKNQLRQAVAPFAKNTFSAGKVKQMQWQTVCSNPRSPESGLRRRDLQAQNEAASLWPRTAYRECLDRAQRHPE